MKKRFLVGITTLALAAGATFGLSQGASTAAAAATSAQTSSLAQRGPGVNDGTHAGGVVASVSGTTITVTGRDGASLAIATTSTTSFTLDGSASSLSAIAAGQFLHADGTTDSNGLFTATAVKVSTTQPQGHRGGPRP